MNTKQNWLRPNSRSFCLFTGICASLASYQKRWTAKGSPIPFSCENIYMGTYIYNEMKLNEMKSFILLKSCFYSLAIRHCSLHKNTSTHYRYATGFKG